MATKTNIASMYGDEIVGELAVLAKLTMAELKERWRSLYETNPPPGIGRGLLTRAIAYRLQEQMSVGLKPLTRRLLEGLAGKAGSGQLLTVAAAPPATVKTVPMREWQGITHEVTVLDRGVLYRKEHYRSLSEVARLITGCRWSGPLFFGLRSKADGEGKNGKH